MADSFFEFFVARDEDLDRESPIEQVFILIRLLFFNLLFGAAFTFSCFCLRRYIGKCFSILFCGLCDGFTCDYDASHGSRSDYQRVLHQRKLRRRRQQLPTIEDNEDQFPFDIQIFIQTLWSNRHTVKMFIFWMSGLMAAYYCFAPKPPPHLAEPVTLVHSFSDYGVTQNNQGNRVIFVMPSHFSGIQNARLARIAQALLPHKDSVTWVIVSTDPISGAAWTWKKTEHFTSQQRTEWKNSVGRVTRHLEVLHEKVARFGIPFVILSGHALHHKNWGFSYAHMKWDDRARIYIQAAHIGVTWAANNLKTGVLFIGEEETTYDSRLFKELQRTRVMSAWPTAFDIRYRLSISTPELNLDNITTGYSAGGIHMGRVPLTHSSYAVGMNLVRKMKKTENLWKLALKENPYSSIDLDINVSRVQPLGANCTEIYAWKLYTTFDHMRGVNRKRAPLKIKWMETNVRVLHKLIETWYGFVERQSSESTKVEYP